MIGRKSSIIRAGCSEELGVKFSINMLLFARAGLPQPLHGKTMRLIRLRV